MKVLNTKTGEITDKTLTKAEQRAWEEFPFKPYKMPVFDNTEIVGDGVYDLNQDFRLFYKAGYEQAEKDIYQLKSQDRVMMENLIAFLKDERTLLQHDCNIMAGWLEDFIKRIPKEKK